MHVRRTRSYFRAITRSGSCTHYHINKSKITIQKSCSEHMRLAESYVHCNVNNWTHSPVLSTFGTLIRGFILDLTSES